MPAINTKTDVPIFILAGEPSGDELAARIMGAVEKAYGKQQWAGVGGQAMAAYDFEKWAAMEQLSIIGFGAVISAYSKLSSLMDQLIDQIIKTRPKLVLTVDAKGFSLRLAARLKRRMAQEGISIPVVHSVAPTVWAWGKWRTKSVIGVVDQLLCLFPFEPDYFEPHGVSSHFIGHPEAENAALMPTKQSPVKTAPHDAPKSLVVLPGSRRGEIARILPRMLRALDLLNGKLGRQVEADHSNFRISLPTIPRLENQVRAIVADHPELSVDVTTDRVRFYDDVKVADAVLAASGTVTLQCALMGAPGVTTYVTSALSAFIGRNLVNMDRVILPNAILGRQIYPFLFQGAASPERIADELQAILEGRAAKASAAKAASDLRKTLQAKGGFDHSVATALALYF